MTREHAQRKLNEYEEQGELGLADLFRTVLRLLDLQDMVVRVAETEWS